MTTRMSIDEIKQTIKNLQITEPERNRLQRACDAKNVTALAFVFLKYFEVPDTTG